VSKPSLPPPPSHAWGACASDRPVLADPSFPSLSDAMSKPIQRRASCQGGGAGGAGGAGLPFVGCGHVSPPESTPKVKKPCTGEVRSACPHLLKGNPCKFGHRDD
jgi:hypothetical protein